MQKLFIFAVIIMFSFVSTFQASAHERGKDYKPKPQIIESYYKIKWGYFDEFLELYNKYHAPILQKMVEQGHMLRVTAAIPKEHGHEPYRWDLRVTQVFPDTKTLEEDGLHIPMILMEMFKDDMDSYKKGEQRRWELVEEHYDINIREQDASKKKISKW